MKLTPKIFALCLIVFFSITLLTAQMRKDKDHSRHSGERSEKQLEKMKAELALTDIQVTQLTAINAEYAAKKKAAKETSTDRATFKTLRTEKVAAVKAILNGEQLTKYEAMKMDRKGRRGEGHRGHRGERGGHGKHAGTPEERAQKQTERLTEKLSLTEDQATKVAALNLVYATKIKAAKDAATDREAKRATVKTLRAEKSTALKDILNSDQLANYEAMKMDRKGRRGEGHRGHRGERGGHGKHTGTPEERAQKRTERLTKKLSLTDAQVAKVMAINLEHTLKRKAIKDGTAEKEAKREAMNTLRTEQYAAIKAVLTPEQATTYDAMKNDRRGKGGKGRGRKG